jgi:hypothetical protein
MDDAMTSDPSVRSTASRCATGAGLCRLPKPRGEHAARGDGIVIEPADQNEAAWSSLGRSRNAQ